MKATRVSKNPPKHSTEPLEQKPYLSRAEAARYLGVSVRFVHDLFERGELPRVKTDASPQGRVLYRRQDLDNYMARHLESRVAR